MDAVQNARALTTSLREGATFGLPSLQQSSDLDAALSDLLKELAVGLFARDQHVEATAAARAAKQLEDRAAELTRLSVLNPDCTCSHDRVRDHSSMVGCERDVPGGYDVCQCTHRNGMTSRNDRGPIEKKLHAAS